MLLTATQQTSRKTPVNILKVKLLGIRLMHHIRTAFLDHKGDAWVPVIDSVHEMAAHSWEVMELLQKKDSPLLLGDYSEQGQESWNKYVSAFKSGPAARSRQNSIKDNTHDILLRTLVMSHPMIVSQKRQKHCTRCGVAGHTARSIQFHVDVVMDEEQAEIEDLFEP